MIYVIVAALVAIGILAVVLYAAIRRLDLAEARAFAAETDNVRLTMRLGAAQAALVPLTWTWRMVESPTYLPTGGDVTRIRHFLILAFTNLQGAAEADDVAMAEILANAPEPPRRMPRYPQVPPYLATPEDVALAPRPEMDR